MSEQEEFIQKLKEAVEWMKNRPVETYGSKEKPHLYYCHTELYKTIKSILNSEDMILTCDGWVKIINIDAPFKFKIKPFDNGDVIDYIPKNASCSKPILFTDTLDEYSIKICIDDKRE